MPAPGTGDREVWGNCLPARQPIDRSEFGYANQHQSNVSLLRGKSIPYGGGHGGTLGGALFYGMLLVMCYDAMMLQCYNAIML